MTLHEITVEIETLKTAIGVNRSFLVGRPAGTDKKTEASIASDLVRLAELRKIEATMIEQDALAKAIELAKSSGLMMPSEIETLVRIHARLGEVVK
jgi:hypothetical protein